jgi:acyl-CoA synthetase (AMP-forming)/AMP-acid ligase II
VTIALRSLGSVTQVATGETWDPARLASEVTARAQRLRELGVDQRHVVLLAHGGTPAFFADLLAIWSIGSCAACVNPALTATELTTIVDFVKPKLSLPARDTLLGENANERRSAVSQDHSLFAEAAPDGLALILFTSGSTGEPKGVAHSFRSLLARLSSNREHIPAHERRVTLCPLPTHFGHGLIGNALTPLLDGGHVLLASSDLKSVSVVGDMISEHGVTFMSSVPAFWRIVGKLGVRRPKDSLQRVHVGSAPLSKTLWSSIMDWAGTRNVVNMYGMTETANWIAGASAVDSEPEDGLVGTGWDSRFALRRPDGRIAQRGAGEVLIKTPSLMTGYYKRPDLTQSVLTGGWFCSGDLGEIDAKGVLRLSGRIKHEINRAGLKVHPEDIEMLLERSGVIEEVCAFGMADDLSGQTIGVAVVPADPENFDLEKLKAWCAARLVREKQPEKWFVVRQIPKNDRGKINRAELAQLYMPQGAI